MVGVDTELVAAEMVDCLCLWDLMNEDLIHLAVGEARSEHPVAGVHDVSAPRPAFIDASGGYMGQKVKRPGVLWMAHGAMIAVDRTFLI